MTIQHTPRRSLYVGLFLITLATLLLELGLTRLFSVIMYYHMAFFAVSVTLFGVAFGGAIVHFFPKSFSVEKAQRAMGWAATGFAFTLMLTLLLLLNVKFDLTRNTVIVLECVGIGLVLAVPFTFGGVAVAVALTRFPALVHRLYAWDLAGAALGCILFGPMIYECGGPRLVMVIGIMLGIAGLILFYGETRRSGAALAITTLLILVIAGMLMAAPKTPWLQLRYTRSGGDWTWQNKVYDEWNAISRITAVPIKDISTGVAGELAEKSRTDQLMFQIDTFAATPMLHLENGDYKSVYYPFHDVSYAAHAVVKNANVAVIGVGGGRDILAAKAWGQPTVTGIEINGRTLQALTNDFAKYNGHLADWPGVKLVKDEARSYIARSPEKFDIIQASLIDTFAATSAGAFVLTENSLYTLEGWKVFLDHLTDRGVLTMTRWYRAENPVETLRLLALARAALEREGAKNPRQHILMARPPNYNMLDYNAPATILVKKTPFTAEEIERFNAWCVENKMIAIVTPTTAATPELSEILTTPDVIEYTQHTQFDLSPPTDNRPFFFDVLRWRDIFNPKVRQGSDYIVSINMKPLVMLGSLLATVIVLAIIFIAVPLWWESRNQLATWPASRRWGMVVYFMMLGLGYIMVELTLLQRLSVFLGHPGYSLMVCLFTLLLTSGIGASLAPRIFGRGGVVGAAQLRTVNLLVWGVQVITICAAMFVIHNFSTLDTPLRLAAAALLLAPAGFLMGMPFPLALQAAARHPGAPLAWFWGVNGVVSVCASVLVIALGHSFGLLVAFVLGACCYLVAAACAGAFAPPAGAPESS